MLKRVNYPNKFRTLELFLQNINMDSKTEYHSQGHFIHIRDIELSICTFQLESWDLFLDFGNMINV